MLLGGGRLGLVVAEYVGWWSSPHGGRPVHTAIVCPIEAQITARGSAKLVCRGQQRFGVVPPLAAGHDIDVGRGRSFRMSAARLDEQHHELVHNSGDPVEWRSSACRRDHIEFGPEHDQAPTVGLEALNGGC